MTHHILSACLSLAPTCSLAASLTALLAPAQQTRPLAPQSPASPVSLEAQVRALEDLLAGVRVEGGRMILDGLNLHIRNGAGPNDRDGSGNLVLGYDEGGVNGIGSHNVVIGPGHEYTGQAAFVSGTDHVATAWYSSLLGGERNTTVIVGAVCVGGADNVADAGWSAALGGRGNRASGLHALAAGGIQAYAFGAGSAVLGGENGAAIGAHSAVRGGIQGRAEGVCATTSGGSSARASGDHASAIGGRFARAIGGRSVALGGFAGQAQGNSAVVCGGSECQATGSLGVAIGGRANEVRGPVCVVVGGEQNVALAGSTYGSLTGGLNNTVGGFASSNSGGSGRWVTATYGWVAGGLFELN